MPANNWARLAEREQIHQEIGFTNINAITGFGGLPGSYIFSLSKPVLYRNVFILKFNKKNHPLRIGIMTLLAREIKYGKAEQMQGINP